LNLIKTSFYTAISTAISFISGFIVIKVVAVKIGPTGLAYVGQFQNTTTILTLLSTGAITAGVVKYLASYHADKQGQQKVITTAISIILLCSLFVSSVVLISSKFLSKATFHTEDYSIVYILYGLFVTLVSLNMLFIAFLNGMKEIKRLTIVNICSSVLGITFTVTFAYWLGIKGVLISANFMALSVFILNLFFLKKFNWLRWKPNFKVWDKKVVKMLSAFTLMNIVSGFLIPAVQLLVRDKIIKDFSLEEAGYWQAVTKISDYYLAFITTVLSVYYLPRLSEISEKSELRNELKKGYKIILPAVAIMAFAIWLAKYSIIQLLFTPKFIPMIPLFKYQLLGDFFKIGSWLVAYIMVAKALTKSYIFTEILFSVTYVILSFIMINKYGLIGATYAFCANYALYWVIIITINKKQFI
jgi:PST family polysaccharide transporter